jgi:hypothetical protein
MAPLHTATTSFMGWEMVHWIGIQGDYDRDGKNDKTVLGDARSGTVLDRPARVI